MTDTARNFRTAISKKNIWFPSDPKRLHSMEALGDKILEENPDEYNITYEKLFERSIKVRRMDWTPLVAAIFVPEEPGEIELREILLFHPERREDGELLRLERAAVERNGSPVSDEQLIISSKGPGFEGRHRSFPLVLARMHDMQHEVAEHTNNFTRLFSPAH